MENIFDIDLSQFSLFKILGLLFYGIIIYLISWLIKNYLIHILIKSPIRKKKVINMLPVVFTLIWTFFTIYVFYFLVRPFPLYGILISLILIYLGRGYLINLVHGMFFRFKGDILIGLSTSGNSKNVVNAIHAAKKKGMKVVGLTGKSGGEMAELCDVEIRAPHSDYADRVQEIHIKVIHSLIGFIENNL